MFGWRWYKVEDNRLYSPLVGRVPLPRNGILEGAYFIPQAERMWSQCLMMAGQRWYEFALTFGEAHGPFERDNSMPFSRSMKSTRYDALAIFTSRPGLQQNYDIPVVEGLLSEDVLLSVEAGARSRCLR